MRAILLGPLAWVARAPDRRFLRRRLRELLEGQGFLQRSGPILRIAVDGGLGAWRALRIEPHLAVGDWDSLSPPDRKALSRIPHLTLPRAKDRSDLWYACRVAHALGATELVCLGVTGGRPDHHVAMLLDLSRIGAELRGLRGVSAQGSEADYYFVSSRQADLCLELPKGMLISIFSLAGVARGVRLQGFRFRPKGGRLVPSSHGLSNLVSKTGVCRIRLRQGRLVVIAPALKKS